MAYNKKTWKARQGLGLNKFSIDGATPVPIVNQPDSVTQQGDALSAGNLNDLEDRIYDAFDDIADGTQIVGKATADASGNVITATYATKSELTSEATARANADSNLLSAITAIDHRVENLEQPKGGYVVENYKDGALTPSGKGNWAIVEGLRGVSRVENQMVKTPTEGGVYSYSTAGNISFDGDTIVNTASTSGQIDIRNQRYQSPLTFYQGHLYLISYEAMVTESVALKTYLKYNLANTSEALTANKWTKISATITWVSATEGTNFFDVMTNSAVSAGSKLSIRNVILTDLSVYFGGTIPSDADTIAKIQQNYPHLLTPSEYGTRIVDSSYSGVRAWARNLFNPQGATAGVSLSVSGGTYSEASHSTSDYLPVTPNTTYYHKNTLPSGSYIVLCFYDENKTFISAVATTNTTTTSPANAKYIRISYLTADVGQICVNVSDSQNGTYTPYFAPNTLSFPSTSLKSAGSVREKKLLNVEVEIDGQKVQKSVKTNPLGSFNGSAMTFVRTTEQSMSLYSIQKTDCKPETFNIFNSFGLPVVQSFNSSTETEEKFQRPNIYGEMYVLLKPSRVVADFDVNYELATPAPSTLSDPIIDNTLLTESGGRMSTVQTGTVVDGSFDMGFITL